MQTKSHLFAGFKVVCVSVVSADLKDSVLMEVTVAVVRRSPEPRGGSGRVTHPVQADLRVPVAGGEVGFGL